MLTILYLYNKYKALSFHKRRALDSGVILSNLSPLCQEIYDNRTL